MITAKLFEVRDRMTFIPIIAVSPRDVSPAEKYLLHRSGFLPSIQYVFVAKLSDILDWEYEPQAWERKSGARTMTVAHMYIGAHFAELESGAVIDAEFILGETAEPKKTERQE